MKEDEAADVTIEAANGVAAKDSANGVAPVPDGDPGFREKDVGKDECL